MSRRFAFLLTVSVLGILVLNTSGCVDRRFVVESDPPNAIVYMNGNRIGATPLDQSFIYDGTYRFVFVKDGYETLTVDEKVHPPWWLIFPLDFVTESLLPYPVRDVHNIRKPLEPVHLVPPEEILKRGMELRAQGQALAPAPLVAAPVPGAPAAQMVPAAPAPQMVPLPPP